MALPLAWLRGKREASGGLMGSGKLRCRAISGDLTQPYQRRLPPVRDAHVLSCYPRPSVYEASLLFLLRSPSPTKACSGIETIVVLRRAEAVMVRRRCFSILELPTPPLLQAHLGVGLRLWIRRRNLGLTLVGLPETLCPNNSLPCETVPVCPRHIPGVDPVLAQLRWLTPPPLNTKP